MTRSASVTHTVGDADTAAALGSGDLPVLATPRVLAWLEAATCSALDLDDSRTSVGTRVEVEHIAASHAPVRVQHFPRLARPENGASAREEGAHMCCEADRPVRDGD